MRYIVLSILWLSLFGVTVGVRVARSKDLTSSEDPITHVRTLVNQAKLDAIPPQTPSLMTTTEVMSSEPTEKIAAALSEYAMSHRSSFDDCKRLIMGDSLQPKEFFEVSFVVARKQKTLEPLVTTTQVKFERGTIPLTKIQEKCIVDALSGIDLAITQEPPTSRIPFQLCLRKITQP